jgi:hypothetical protein
MKVEILQGLKGRLVEIVCQVLQDNLIYENFWG